jgi:nicotinate phosphoribosyltransferase
MPVEKRSSQKVSRGGTKKAVRFARSTGTIVEEVVYPADAPAPQSDDLLGRPLMIPMIRGGERQPALPDLSDARDLVARNLVSLPWEGLNLSRGEAAVPTRFIG